MDDGRPIQILLVEDDVGARRALVRLLTVNGYIVSDIGTVREALALAASQRFDLLISDHRLPDGSGLDVMREVKKQYGMPGIAVSSTRSPNDATAALEAGFHRHLAKPVPVNNLLDAIRDAIRAGAPERDGRTTVRDKSSE